MRSWSKYLCAVVGLVALSILPSEATQDKFASQYAQGNRLLLELPDSALQVARELLHEAEASKDNLAQAMGLELQGRALFETSAYKEAQAALDQAATVYAALDYTPGSAICLRYLGLLSDVKGAHIEARSLLNQSLDLYEGNDDSSNIAYVLNDLGNLYKSLGQRRQALDYYNRSFDIRKSTNDSAGIAGSLISLGLMEGEQMHLDQSLKHFKESLAIAESINNYRLVVSALNNIGSIHGSLGNYDLAKQFFLTVKNSAESRSDHLNASKALNNIALLHSLTGEFQQARRYFNQVLDYRRQIDQKEGIVRTLNNIGRTYTSQMRYGQALPIYREAYNVASSIGSVPVQYESCKGLYLCFKMTGNQSSALIYHEEMALLEDSLNLYESGQELQRLEFEQAIYADSIQQAALKQQREVEHQAELRKSRNTRNALIGSGIAALLLAGSFYSRYRIVNKARKEVEIEKKRSDDLLLNILPAEVAQELKTEGHSVAREFNDVTVLFTDFKGFTDAASNLHAKEVVERLNHYFKAFDRIAKAHQIEKIKTIGDAYMAAAGLPNPSTDAAANSVLAALEMQHFIDQNNTFNPSFSMRVGLHTGPVVAGIVGHDKFQYDIWGDTVNTAARMESHGDVGRVNVSATTYTLLKDDTRFVFEARDVLHVKGKGDLQMYFVRLA